MSLGWISLDKNAKPPLVVRKVDKIDDIVQQHLKDLVAGNSTLNDQMKQEYKKRKLIQEM
jgi:phenylalanyl-tRNA synthetase alpha chain